MKQLLKIKIVVLVIALVVIALSSCGSKSGQRGVKHDTLVHNYDYLFEVKDSNGVLIYGIFDKDHHCIGTVKASELDSLIISDNQ